jgi:hypothetical protein
MLRSSSCWFDILVSIELELGTGRATASGSGKMICQQTPIKKGVPNRGKQPLAMGSIGMIVVGSISVKKYESSLPSLAAVTGDADGSGSTNPGGYQPILTEED